MTYSLDCRRKVLRVRAKAGLSIRAAAQRFNIDVATLTRGLKRIETCPAKTRQRKLAKSVLQEDVKRYADAYQ